MKSFGQSFFVFARVALKPSSAESPATDVMKTISVKHMHFVYSQTSILTGFTEGGFSP